jgi:hypothetical protein
LFFQQQYSQHQHPSLPKAEYKRKTPWILFHKVLKYRLYNHMQHIKSSIKIPGCFISASPGKNASRFTEQRFSKKIQSAGPCRQLLSCCLFAKVEWGGPYQLQESLPQPLQNLEGRKEEESALPQCPDVDENSVKLTSNRSN